MIFSSSLLFTQSENQRIGVEEDPHHTFSFAGTLDFSAETLSEYNTYTFIPTLSVDYMYSNLFYSGIMFPFKSTISMEEENDKPILFAVGDPSISIGLLQRFDDFKLRLNLSYSFPLGIWKEKEIEEKGIVSSSGYHTVNFTASLSRILDPVILNSTLSYSVGLPRKEDQEWSMLPGIISLSFSTTEVLNDNVGFRFGISNNLSLPKITSGDLNKEEFSYSLSIFASLLWNKNNFNSSIEVKHNLSSILSAPTLSLSGGWDLEINND